MNDKDLEYLLSYTRNYKRNTYKAVRMGTNSTHIHHLNQTKINYEMERISKAAIHFKVHDKLNSHLFSFEYPYYPNNQPVGVKIAADKFLTENHFLKSNIKSTNSKQYASNEVERAFEETFNNEPDKKVVIKPKSSSLGRGVFVNVSRSNFKEIWHSIKPELTASEQKRFSNFDFLVQEILQGFEARATVIQGNLVSIVVRIPAYVVGDGRKSISDLIVEKNRVREQCSYQKRFPITVTNKVRIFLESQGRNIEDVPNENEAILLSSVSNISGGGELFNITELVDDSIKEFILNALASIPGLYTAGLDILMRSFDDSNVSVLEVNTYPNITNTKYPTYGNPAMVSKVLIDSLISLNQIGRSKNARYDIENEDIYLSNFIEFTKRKEKYSASNYNL